MKILLAENSGFCFGVKRAMDIALGMDSKNGNVYTYGPLIHNEQAVERLSDNGIKIAYLDDISGTDKLIIRTHGVTPEVIEKSREKGAEIVDATCPFVKKIHNIVSRYHSEGYQIVIVGDSSHPEVIGINGWCGNSAVVIDKPEDIYNISTEKPLCYVVQTTFSLEIWTKIKNIAKKSCQAPLIFDTICNATEKRQSEAEKIASQVDAMLVIGGKDSSNTKKLVDICTGRCPDTYHIETFNDIPKSVFGKSLVGITAGASTPEWIIKEVIEKMSEEKMIERTDEFSFAEELEKSMISLKSGDIVTGTVIGINPTEVIVNLGSKADGFIPVGELTDDPSVNPMDIVKIGDEISVFVVRVNDVEGTIMLSKKKIDSIKGRKVLEAALETGEVLNGTIVEAVNGGVIVLSNGARVFVPASQASTRFVKELDSLVGDEVSFRIIDINQRRNKIVGSIKSVASEVRKVQLETFWSSAEVGKEYSGVVKSLTDFGAFVDIGGVDGLIHISELSWGRIKHPSEVISVGDVVNVNILAIDREKNKISLGYRKAEDNPWEIAKVKFNMGDTVTAKIIRMVSFGAFAEIIPGVEGLIHISQIADRRIEKVASVLSIGQEVEAKIIGLDFENKKISLSIRALIEPAAEEEELAPIERPEEIVPEEEAEKLEAVEAVEPAAEEAAPAETEE